MIMVRVWFSCRRISLAAEHRSYVFVAKCGHITTGNTRAVRPCALARCPAPARLPLQSELKTGTKPKLDVFGRTPCEEQGRGQYYSVVELPTGKSTKSMQSNLVKSIQLCVNSIVRDP